MVLKIKSNLIQTLTRISVEIRTGKERSYGPILRIVTMFPPTLVKSFQQFLIGTFRNLTNYIKSLTRAM